MFTWKNKFLVYVDVSSICILTYFHSYCLCLKQYGETTCLQCLFSKCRLQIRMPNISPFDNLSKHFFYFFTSACRATSVWEAVPRVNKEMHEKNLGKVPRLILSFVSLCFKALKLWRREYSKTKLLRSFSPFDISQKQIFFFSTFFNLKICCVFIPDPSSRVWQTFENKHDH